MEQSLGSNDMSVNDANVKVLVKKRNNGIKRNKCDQCDFADSRPSALRIHLQIHTGEKSHKCSQCEYASTNPSNLRAHLKTHSGEKSNKCNQCGYACSEPSALRSRMNTHSGKNQTSAINVPLHPRTWVD